MINTICAILWGAALVTACVASAQAPAPYDRAIWRTRYERPKSIPFPAGNRFSEQREQLGRTLFFDPRLSGSGLIACASCHDPKSYWTDGLPKAVGSGKKILRRRTPTLLNLAWAELLFWDGRAESLEEQALAPIEATGEMNLPLKAMAGIIRGIPGYRSMFDRAYPGEPIAPATVGRAIAVFERTIVSGRTPFDEWAAGNDRAISKAAKRGFDLFHTKAACYKCHSGWNFTDDGFHDIGLPDADIGRGAWLPLEAMQHAFKTPTLRNVANQGPYMHDGSERSLEDVIELYDRGGQAKRPSLSPDIQPLHLTSEEKADLIAFLRTLSSSDKPIVPPLLPH